MTPPPHASKRKVSLIDAPDTRADSICLAGTCVVAKDGKLVAAGSWACTFQHTHFDVMSGPDQAEFARLLEQ
jgi:hypothetical protein